MSSLNVLLLSSLNDLLLTIYLIYLIFNKYFSPDNASYVCLFSAAGSLSQCCGLLYPLPFPTQLWASRRWTGSFSRGDRWRDIERERERERVVGGYESGGVGCVKMGGCCFCCLSISAILVGGVGVDRGAIWLLAIFAWRHPLIYPV